MCNCINVRCEQEGNKKQEAFHICLYFNIIGFRVRAQFFLLVLSLFCIVLAVRLRIELYCMYTYVHYSTYKLELA
jgi:hypothetical protein